MLLVILQFLFLGSKHFQTYLTIIHRKIYCNDDQQHTETIEPKNLRNVINFAMPDALLLLFFIILVPFTYHL